MICSSADLSNSDKTDGFLKKTHALMKGDFSGAFLQAGVAELTMACVMMGMQMHGGIIPACGTFFVFSDYMKPAVRMAALMELPVKFIWSHDAFRVGEDGPTHEPVEQEAQIRLLEKLKNHHGRNSMLVLRPADAEETTMAWRLAMENTLTPTALILSRQDIPTTKANAKVRLGVSAVALDHKTESEIAWSNYMEPATYVYNDDIQSNKKTIKPNEEFTLSYIDPEHPAAKWEIVKDGEVVKSGEGNSWTVSLADVGSYDLKVTGNEYGEDGAAKQTTRTFASYIQITGEGTGALPEIYTLTANGSDEEVSIKTDESVKMAYTGRAADGAGSQGLDLQEKRFGVAAADLGLVGKKSYSISFWLKINSLKSGDPTTLFNVYNKQDGWPKTDWGWNWSGISMGSITWISSRHSAKY